MFIQKIEGICPKGHPFTTTPSVHLRKDSKGGCKECAYVAISESKKDTLEIFILKANENL
jgi:hypothetical protein